MVLNARPGALHKARNSTSDSNQQRTVLPDFGREWRTMCMAFDSVISFLWVLPWFSTIRHCLVQDYPWDKLHAENKSLNQKVATKWWKFWWKFKSTQKIPPISWNYSSFPPISLNHSNIPPCTKFKETLLLRTCGKFHYIRLWFDIFWLNIESNFF